MNTRSPPPPDRHTIVDFIGDILGRRGAESYLGEQVTMSGHMLQCAMLAEREQAGDELVAAALLHDIGHYCGEFPEDALERGIDNLHEEAGAAILAPYFPALVIDCVRWHVAAKRYLCTVDRAYFKRLSAASVHTLELQGGAMTAEEASAFGLQPNLAAIVRVRQWDEGAKVPGRSTPGYDHYAPLLRRLVGTAN